MNFGFVAVVRHAKLHTHERVYTNAIKLADEIIFLATEHCKSSLP